jgi:Tol biopolymer transport system component
MNDFMRGAGVRRLSVRLLVGALPALGCGGGGDITTPSTGGLEITTSTSGPEPDGDGYAISIDQAAEIAIGVNATLQRDNLEPGSHTVRLGGLAANCTVEGDNPRNVNVSAGSTATVAYTVTCNATTGSIRVTASTTGPSPDADGYTITLNGTDRGSLTTTGEVTVDELAPGDYQIGLSGIAGNCQAQPNPQSVTVTAGSTIMASFAVSCVALPPTTGTIAVSTVTTGTQLDPDGYTMSLDGGAGQTIGLNAMLMISPVAPGTHQVELAGMATNCRVDGDNPRSVTVSAGTTTPAAFNIACPAPRLSKIVFVSERDYEPHSHTEIYSMNTDGSGATRLTDMFCWHGSPTYSPDGKKILFGAGGGSECEGIFIMNADGSGLARLTLDIGGFPHWSPDGRKIAFSSGSLEGNHGIFVMNADGSGVTQLTSHTGDLVHDGSPDWSPDARKIAFARYTNWQGSYFAEVYVMNADGTGQTRITTNEAAPGIPGWSDQAPDWSPNGSRIAFTRTLAHPGGGFLGSDIFVMNPDGSGLTQLTDGTGHDDPEWSPDGSKIAFSSTHFDGTGEIYVMNPDGSGKTNLTNHPAEDTEPSWSP